MRVSGNTSLKNYMRLLTVGIANEPEIEPVFTFRFRFKRYRFIKTLFDLPFYDFQVAQKYSDGYIHAANMLVEVCDCHANDKRQAQLYNAFLNMPIKNILPIIVQYQKEFRKIAKLFEEQSELLTKKETGKYDFEEFGYSSVSLLLADGNRQIAREFIDKQPVAYIIAEYRREIKTRENERYIHERIIEKSKIK